MNEQHSARTTETHKHTPGPWRVDPTHWLCIESAANGNVALVNLARSSEADARLIAAAPDLLASLKAVREWMDNPEVNPECPFSVSAASAIRIAIAKAEGRS